MAKTVQVENGYTKIANELLEVIAKVKLSPTQHSIILVIWRYTYGFQRKEHKISLSFLAKATECDQRNIQREIKKLVHRKIIRERMNGNCKIIGFNKNYQDWIGKIDIGEIDNGKTDNCQNGHTSIGETAVENIGEIDNQERKKEKLKEKDFEGIYNYYCTLDLIKHRIYKPEMETAMKRAMNELNCDIEHLKVLLNRHEEKVKATKNDKYSTKPRGISEFFGQVKSRGTQLICSEYDDEVYIPIEKEDEITRELNKIL